MIRPSIPVRDGILAPYRARMPGAQRLPHPTIADYTAGWRWGFLCGAVAGALFLAIAWGCTQERGARAAGVHSVAGKVYDGATLIGVCGGVAPAPGSLPQPAAGVDITWYPSCP